MNGNPATSGVPEPFTIGDGAILEVAPPVVRRRSLLAGAALGITTTALPRAAMAASPGTLEPSGAFTYEGGSQVLLSWTGYDSTGTASQAGTPRNSNPVSGVVERGGTSGGVTARAGSSSGDSFTEWTMQNAGDELTVSGDDLSASPHLRWTVTNTSTTNSLEVSSLVLYRLRNLAASINNPGELRLAFYVSTAADFGTPVLRRTISMANDITRHVVIQLGLSGANAVSPSGTAVVRAFPYRTSTQRQVRFRQYNSSDGNVDGVLRPLIAGPDDIQTSIVGTTFTTAGDHTAAFIGRSL